MNNPYTHGPYGAKGAGELPLVGAAPAYVEAMENALGANLNKIPFTTEDAMRILQEGNK
jgi:CO/xanthine dehydrogenase Mo-binding subunit